MTLKIDRRAQYQGKPGLHVLLIGVSAYPFLPATDADPDTPDSYGLRRLTASATSAYRLFKWFESRNPDQFSVPLKTCCVLLSPTDAEIARLPALNGFAAPATLTNVQAWAKQWRGFALDSTENMTLFYFAGHGIRRSGHDAALLLQDFANGLGGALAQSISVGTLVAGMAPAVGQEKIALNQLYLIDSCRSLPPQFKSLAVAAPSAVWDPPLPNEDRRNAPLYFATADGANSFEIRDDQTLFSRAFLEVIEQAADRDINDPDDRWRVTSHLLDRGLRYHFDRSATTTGGQKSFLEGVAAEFPFYYPATTPTADVELVYDPETATQTTTFAATCGSFAVPQLPSPLVPHPHPLKCPAGVYSAVATATDSGGQTHQIQRALVALPVRRNTWKVRWNTWPN